MGSPSGFWGGAHTGAFPPVLSGALWAWQSSCAAFSGGFLIHIEGQWLELVVLFTTLSDEGFLMKATPTFFNVGFLVSLTGLEVLIMGDDQGVVP